MEDNVSDPPKVKKVKKKVKSVSTKKATSSPVAASPTSPRNKSTAELKIPTPKKAASTSSLLKTAILKTTKKVGSSKEAPAALPKKKTTTLLKKPGLPRIHSEGSLLSILSIVFHVSMNASICVRIAFVPNEYFHWN
jgi:hypothetical protein